MKPIRKFGFGPIRAISELYPTKLGIRPDFTRTKNPPTHSVDAGMFPMEQKFGNKRIALVFKPPV